MNDHPLGYTPPQFDGPRLNTTNERPAVGSRVIYNPHPPTGRAYPIREDGELGTILGFDQRGDAVVRWDGAPAGIVSIDTRDLILAPTD